MTKPPYVGGCACRSIRYESSAEPLLMAHCQCSDCQEQTGGGHASVLVFPKAAVKLSGYPAEYASIADSGKKKTRGFCSTCGSPLYTLLESMPDAFVLKASSLDDPTLFRPQMVLYTDSGHHWDHLDPALTRFARMPTA
ncbi:MAG TPA: GFA family protein [Casimicrobiaceae bacterium]|nr:GFA family protein [Casimicrobiaceae bacterium]